MSGVLAGINSGVAGGVSDDTPVGGSVGSAPEDQLHAGGAGEIFGGQGHDLLGGLADLPGTESEEEPIGETQPTQPASPATLEASRAALAAALGGPVELGFVDGMPATILGVRSYGNRWH